MNRVGAHNQIHTATLVDVASPLPVIVEWIDTPERVDRLLARFCDMVAEGLVTVETVQVAKFAHRVLKDVTHSLAPTLSGLRLDEVPAENRDFAITKLP